MTQTIDRNYLEIKSIDALKESTVPEIIHSIHLADPIDFQINKFFYKNIGKKYRWTDRLVWSDSDWIKYVSNTKVETYILKINNDLAGYFELIIHTDIKEIEIAYFGLLEEYHNKKNWWLLTFGSNKEIIFKKRNKKNLGSHMYA